ncbi:mucin-13 [Drosophila sechellia]|uniref:GM22951 n=1 Tax=Drosophila sechellia TaxID=7238 RepID=B4I728_DROSE|nr:mucin-13 [Drosophila sechellia]EDW56126.1 GM22951 [Drosophila sechellia]
MFKLTMLMGLALMLAPSAIQAKSLCRSSGYFALVENTPDFYACQSTAYGGYSMRFLRCPAGLVFSSSMAQCVQSIDAFEARDGSNIENPTIPPSNLDESTTEKPATEAPGTTEKPETEAPETTEKPVTEAPGTTEKPATDAPGSTQKPTTDAPGTTENPETTDAPTTDEPSTAETSTDEPNTETTASGDETTTSDGGVTTPEDNVCATTGLFPTGSCTQFIVCSYADGDELKAYTKKCPGEMQFDPFNSVCSAYYDCTARN